MVADSLAKNSMDHAHGLVTFDQPPIQATSAFADDYADALRTRRTCDGPSGSIT